MKSIVCRKPAEMLALILSFLLSHFAVAQSWTDFSSAVPKVAPPTTGGAWGSTGSYSLNPLPPGTPPLTSNATLGTPLVSSVRNWKLGVYVRNYDVGAMVQQIDAGSAAQTAGINVGDVIVAVAGNRIGEFDGRVVDIGDELRRSADPFGRVSLVIQDARTKNLRATVVTLSSSSGQTTGSVAVGDRASLPSGSVLTVQITNVSKPFFEVAGGKSVSRAEGVGPFPFSLNYDPRYIDSRDQYALNAWITWNNQVIYSMRQPIPVAASGLTQSFQLVAERGNYLATSGGTTIPGISTSSGNPISSASPGYGNVPGATDAAALNQLLVAVLGRPASSAELLAWQSFLQQGKSLNDVAIKLMTSNQYRERFPTDSAYIQQVLQTLTGRPPTDAEVQAWMARLQSVGSAERVIAEMLAQRR
ncbi:MAG: YbaY family lipoprotein [Planctomycetota bacterium]